MKRLIFIVLLIGVSLFAQEKSAFTLADLYHIKYVSDLQISPDGTKIAYVLSHYKLEAGQSFSDLYWMNLDGSHPTRLTYNEADDYHPRWSADGRKLLFISTRSGEAQIWQLPIDGGEPVQLTDYYDGVQSAEWIGASNKVAFVSRVFPECGADQQCNRKTRAAMDEGPVQAHLADELLYRHWTYYQDGQRDHIILFDPETQIYSDLTPGDFDAPDFQGGFAVSPDGKYLCYESNHDANPAESTNKDLFLTDIDAGKTINITRSNTAYDGHPVFSPDSKKIAYQMQRVPGFESDLMRLAVYDIDKETTKIQSDDFAYPVSEIRWSADGQTIYFKVEEKGHLPVYRLHLKNGKIEKAADLQSIASYALDPNGSWLIVTRSSVGEPVEMYRVSQKGPAEGKKSERLTFYNKALEDSIDIRPAEEMWIESPTGKKIHTFIVKPHGFDPSKKYPLIINVHGGPQFQWSDGFRGDWQVYPGSGYIVAFPNPHGSTGYGQDFTDAISKDWGGKVYRDVMAVTDYLADLDYVDEDRMGAMGWSYGGYMMMWLEGQTTRFKTLAAMMGIYDLPAFYGSTEELWFPNYDLGGAPWENSDSYQKFSPHRFANNFKTPCLVITGVRDYRVPYTQSLEFFTALQKKKVPSRLIIFKNDGHWPNYVKSMPLYYNAHLDWFHKYLGGEPAPYDVQKMIRNQVFCKGQSGE